MTCDVFETVEGARNVRRARLVARERVRDNRPRGLTSVDRVARVPVVEVRLGDVAITGGRGVAVTCVDESTHSSAKPSETGDGHEPSVPSGPKRIERCDLPQEDFPSPLCPPSVRQIGQPIR